VSGAALDRVETARLVCVRMTLTPEHQGELASLLRDPRVARTLLPDGEPAREAEVAANLRAKVEHWAQHGFGFWMLYDRVDGAFAGRGGLQHTLATGRDEVEIGWAIAPERWGQGLATELALASVGAAFETLELPELIAYARVDNSASRRVMEKAGLTYEREIEHAGLPHALYRRVRC
jgi:ribosomal-protein-alanine N-acetyltransferase